MKENLIAYRDGGNLMIQTIRETMNDGLTLVIADPSDTSWAPEWSGKELMRLHNNGNGYVLLGRGRVPWMQLDYDVAAELYELLRVVHEQYETFTTRYGLKEDV